MKQLQPLSHSQIISAVTRLPDTLVEATPPGWSIDVPLVRISTCGRLTIEVLREVHSAPDGHATFVYSPPKLPRNGAATALNLLKLLVSQPGRFATKDWLIEKLRPNKSDGDEWEGLVRLDNIVSLLRSSLCPLEVPHKKQVGRLLLEYIPPTPESGSGYRLAAYPFIWLDVEALSSHVKRACQMETEGQDAWGAWYAAYQIGNQGPFLSEGWYSDWAIGRREEVEGYLWQSVQALWRLAVARSGDGGEDEALRLLREYWLRHIENEDALLPLIQLLGNREDYQRTEQYYTLLCETLDQKGQIPGPRLQEVMAFLHDQQTQDVREHAIAPTRISDDNRGIEISQSLALAYERKNHLLAIDWGEAPSSEQFYGREEELAALTSWVIEKHCRLVAILGMGGVGKTSLAVVVVGHVKDAFEYVFWRSLQHALPLRPMLQDCIKFFSGQQQTDFPDEMNDLILLLICYLREHRCLFVLDNCETVLQSGRGTGTYRDGYEDYGRLFRQLGEAHHQSCLLLTSREKTKEIALLEGGNAPVLSYHLYGLKHHDGVNIIHDKGLMGEKQMMKRLVDLYEGNPLALKLVSQFICEVFDGKITAFLEDGQMVFSDIQEILDQQVQRLSPLEREIMYWLAIEREAVSHQNVNDNLVQPVSRRAIQEALQSLRRRYLIETSASGFTLQNVVMEYMTECFIKQICTELYTGTFVLLHSHALIQAQAKEYVRESQVRLMMQPLIQYLLVTFGWEGSEILLRQLLVTIRTAATLFLGYAAGNILNILILSGYDLRGYDFSHLTIRQAYLRGATLPEVDLTASHLLRCIFTESFGSVLSTAFSPDGKRVAAGTANGEVRIWKFPECQLLMICPGHTDWVRSVAFSPDGQTLASCSEDQTIRLWTVETGQCFVVLQGHTSWIRAVAFSSNGKILASCGDDQAIRIWDLQSSQCISILQGHDKKIWSVTFHPDGKILASGSEDQTIRLWDTTTGSCLNILQDTNAVHSIAFSPDGHILASGNESWNVQLWNVQTGQCLSTLCGHTDRVRAVAFLSDGLCASGSDDRNIRVWDTTTGLCLKTLQGHTNLIWSLTFAPGREGRILISGSHDQTVRVWDVQNGECLNILQGHTDWVRSVAFAPNGLLLASDSSDQTIHLWNIQTNQCQRVLRGHINLIWSLAFSPNGRMLASSSEDQTVRIWDVETGYCLQILQGHTSWVRTIAYSPAKDILASGSEDGTVKLWNLCTGDCVKTLQGHANWIRSVAFSPDGQMLASGSDDQTIRLWGVETGQCFQVLSGHRSWVWSVAFSPDGHTLASGSHDQTIRFWETGTGLCLKTLAAHSDWVWSVAFSPDGSLLASGSHDQTVRIWETGTGLCQLVLHGHASWVWSVMFSPDGTLLASGSNDGTIKLWHMPDGQCTNTFKNEKPYEKMNITGITGLIEAQKAALLALGAIEIF